MATYVYNPANRWRHLLVAAVTGIVLMSGASAQATADVPWKVSLYGGPYSGFVLCPSIGSTTARGAVRNCLVRVGAGAPAFDTFKVTGSPVCKTTHKATSSLGTGYVYTTAYPHPGCS
jgi:hypothetical protein